MPSPPQPATLGRYRLLEEIGRGAMGRVFRALDPNTDRIVALKALDAGRDRPAAPTDEARVRFLREARAAGRLAHPGIVAVYDADIDAESGTPYLAMELVVGGSLAERIEARGPLRWGEAVTVAAAVADALDHAHERGVVHRDLKPANVLLADDGAVKVSDFGVARLLDDSSTLTGALRGTPAYMAPEQIRGDAVDGRADLYALGTLLYEMVTGEAPFRAESAIAVAHQVVHDAPRPPSLGCPDLPLEIEGVIRRAMAKRADERFTRGREMAAALRAAGAPSPPPLPAAAPVEATLALPSPPVPARPPAPGPPSTSAPPSTSRRSPALNLAVIAVVLVAATAGGLWLARGRQAPVEPTAPPPATLRPLPAPAATPESGPDAPNDVDRLETTAATGEAAAPAREAAPPPVPDETPPAPAGVPVRAPAPPAVAPAATPVTAPAEPPPSSQTASAEGAPPPAEALPATIEIHFVHRVRAGTLEVWVDGEPAWSTPLESPKNPLRRIGGEELISTFSVPAGAREIEVRVANDSERLDARETLSGELKAGETRVLRVVLVPLRGKLRLKWEP